MKSKKAQQEAERVTTRNVNIPPEDTVASILARPGSYDACLLGLAHAFEAQRERIADLEDDVERLRPKEAFVPERLFSYDSGNTSVLVDTDSGGGICIDATDLADRANVVTMLTKAQGIELAAALTKWAESK